MFNTIGYSRILPTEYIHIDEQQENYHMVMKQCFLLCNTCLHFKIENHGSISFQELHISRKKIFLKQVDPDYHMYLSFK